MTNRKNIIATLIHVDQEVEAVEKCMLEVLKLFELKDVSGFEFDKVYSQLGLVDEIADLLRDRLKKSRQGIVYNYGESDDNPPY